MTLLNSKIKGLLNYLNLLILESFKRPLTILNGLLKDFKIITHMICDSYRPTFRTLEVSMQRPVLVQKALDSAKYFSKYGSYNSGDNWIVDVLKYVDYLEHRLYSVNNED